MAVQDKLGREFRARFGERLRLLMVGKGWNQSELARQAGLPRDSISTYIRGAVYPTPKSMASLSDALGMTVEDLAGSKYGEAMDGSNGLVVKVESLQDSPGKSQLTINAVVSSSIAARVFELVHQEQPEPPRR